MITMELLLRSSTGNGTATIKPSDLDRIYAELFAAPGSWEKDNECVFDTIQEELTKMRGSLRGDEF